MGDLPKRRGRPRKYDPGHALDSAREVFWKAGFAGASLDALGVATGMKRPSLYGAFGDKQALYLKTLERYREQSRAGLREALDPALPLREGLEAMFAAALDLYLTGPEGGRGCFLIGTATSEAVQNRAVRAALQDSLRTFDDALAERLRRAIAQGELPPGTDPLALARLAAGILYSLAVRARAGEERAVLQAIAASAVAMVCGRAT